MKMTGVARSNRDVDRAWALHREVRQIVESLPARPDARALEEVQRLCGMAKATLDDLYCRDVVRAIAVCVDCLSAAGREGAGDEASIRALIQSLMAAFEGRLRDLESDRRPGGGDTDVRTGHGNRRRAQRRNYVTRPLHAPGYPRPDMEGPPGSRRL